MTKILNHISTYADLTAYNNDTNKDYPNVSYIQATDEVKWVGEDPTLIIAKYDVTSTSSATKLLGATTNISKMWIDGVEQQSVVKTYTFSTTGEHELRYKYEGNNTAYGLFMAVENLTSVTINATTPPKLSSGAFDNTNANLVIYVPAESLETYKTTGNWVSLASRIQSIS